MFYNIFNNVFSDSIETKCEVCNDDMLIFNGESAHMSSNGKFLCSVCQKDRETVLMNTKIGFYDLSEDQKQDLQHHIVDYVEALKNMNLVCRVCNNTLVFGQDDFSITKDQDDFGVICRYCLENSRD